ncbi:Wzz/FepE/Etk N-terminal domain-containing protein [Pseudomonas muyukensis]|uniref:Chain-length determining protein n=1 Tax=Pseudomonas muyukensis TaxID=2842357 RepID=A0ABX8ME79_9PSED|nr:Wzz/FepE/Etk N-terminal domain-containing protein [Pseudomonas muyukensis]QXH37103.1 chain-length determining protein [Pseudomonas muyukensis]
MSKAVHLPPVPVGELDISALLRSIWRQRKLVAICVALGGIVFAAYAFLATPTYQTTSVLRAVPVNELDALNRSKLYELPPKRALLEVAEALQSYELRLNYFRENRALFSQFDDPDRTLEQNFEEFDRDALQLELPSEKRPYLTVRMQYLEGVSGPQIVNSLVDYAVNEARKQIDADMEVIIRNRISELDSQIAAAEAVYRSAKQTQIAQLLEADRVKQARLQDELRALRQRLKTGRAARIATLDEAISIAGSLGIKRPSTPSSMGDAERGAVGNMVRTEVTNQSLPLYFMGSDALQAERKVLLARKTDDFAEARVADIQKELQLLTSNRQVEALNARQDESVFYGGLEGVRKEMVRLKNLNINLDRLKLVTVDRKALQPARPMKPKRVLVSVAGLLLGLLVGLLVATLRHLWSQNNGQDSRALNLQRL